MKIEGRLFSPLLSFFKTEASGGLLLLAATVLALVFVNSPLKEFYLAVIHIPLVSGFDLHHFVNDALMVIFFYVVGLEIKRELQFGALARPKDAALPLFAALGGMIVPAMVYLILNPNQHTHHGWGIPMATDIAFAVGVISVFGKRIPFALKAFLLAFAIIDDLGAILVIAFFYTAELKMQFLGIAAGVLMALYILNRSGLRNVIIGITGGVLVWYCFLQSGIHATIAGVILAFLTPTDLQEDGSHSLDRWIHNLHHYIAFGIMPVFAFFNAGVDLRALDLSLFLQSSISHGIVLGLTVGKPLGILIACYLAVKLGLAKIPSQVRWPHLLGAGCLGGIGFTMSLFIGSLSFKDPQFLDFAKASILIASVISAALGYLVLSVSTKEKSIS